MSRRKRSTSTSGFGVREQLELFVAKARELEDGRLFRNDPTHSFSMRWNRVEGLQFASREPNEEDLRSFLLTFRQFISNDEPIYLFRIYNLCQQHLTSDAFKGYLIESRKIWKRQLQKGGFYLTYNGREVTPEQVTDLWINGYYFHNDPSKLRMLRNLLPHEQMVLRFLFLEHILASAQQVMYVSFIIKAAFRDGLLSGQ